MFFSEQMFVFSSTDELVSEFEGYREVVVFTLNAEFSVFAS